MIRAMLSVACLWSPPVSAWAGPRVVGDGKGTVYAGTGEPRLTALAITPDVQRVGIPLDEVFDARASASIIGECHVICVCGANCSFPKRTTSV